MNELFNIVFKAFSFFKILRSSLWIFLIFFFYNSQYVESYYRIRFFQFTTDQEGSFYLPITEIPGLFTPTALELVKWGLFNLPKKHRKIDFLLKLTQLSFNWTLEAVVCVGIVFLFRRISSIRFS
jgi:hypothetical protein